MLLGRDDERAVIARTVASARGGTGAVLVVRGGVGIGKTALLGDAVESADDFTVVAVSGVESEAPLAYAALHRVLLPFLDALDGLPTPQRDALASAFGLAAAGAPDQFLIGLAALTLLGEATHHRPLLCVIDDTQWIDRDSLAVLTFVSRRLLADPLAMIFAIRDPSDVEVLAGIDELVVGPLTDDASHALCARSVGSFVNRRVSEQIVAQTQGNPLALVELARELSEGQLLGGAPLPVTLPVGHQLEARFLRQVGTLPAPAGTLLLVASADPQRSPVTLRRAAEALGISMEEMEPAERAGLVEISTWVEFRHPLVRSAVYGRATDAERRRVHGVLASIADSESEHQLQASHLAAAAEAPDEDVAAQLEIAADSARQRGGPDAQVALLLRAAELSPAPDQRGRRLLAAATAASVAGSFRSAAPILEQARPLLADPVQRAAALRLEGALCIPLGRNVAAPRHLIAASEAFRELDPVSARETMLEALNASTIAGRYCEDPLFHEVADASRALVGRSTAPRTPLERVLAACASLIRDDPAPDPGAIRDLAALLGSSPVTPDQLTRWCELSMLLSTQVLDHRAQRDMFDHMETSARNRGALLGLGLILSGLASFEIRAGRFDLAAAHYAERTDIANACGEVLDPTWLDVELLSWQGDDRTPGIVRAMAELADRFGSGALLYTGLHALTTFELGVGHYAEALAASLPAFEDRALGWECYAFPDVVEAAARVENRELVEAALERFDARATAAGTPWALGLLARARALAASSAHAERHYGAALELLGATPWRTEEARTHLVYGEWLRREKRRSEARQQLRAAHEMFATMGALGFAERARLELLATGERARARRSVAAPELTARELQIARLAAQRSTSREIGAQLFISPNTVDYHLRKVFQKLGVSSRRDLAERLPTV